MDFEARAKCITGTDIGALIGVNPWKTPLDVYLEKVGLTHGIPDNKYMEWGRRLEAVVAKKYAESIEGGLQHGSFRRDGIIGGTPDYLTDSAVIEIKTANARSEKDWGEEGTDHIPQQYLAQILWYMGLEHKSHGICAVLIGGNDYRVYKIARNEALLTHMIETAQHFWENHVIPQIPPEATGRDNEGLKVLYPTSNQEIINAPCMCQLAEELDEINNEVTKFTRRAEEIVAEMKAEIGPNAGINTGKHVATWKKTKDGAKTDWNKIAIDLHASPELIAAYTIPTIGYRRFSFKRIENGPK